MTIEEMKKVLKGLGYFVFHYSRVKMLNVQFSLASFAYIDTEIEVFAENLHKKEAIRAIAAEIEPRLRWVKEEEKGEVKYRTSLTYVEKADSDSS